MKKVLLLTAFLLAAATAAGLEGQGVGKEITAEQARGGMNASFSVFTDVLTSLGYAPLTAEPGTDRFQQFTAAAVLVFIFLGEVYPVHGLIRFLLTMIIVGILGSNVDFDWFTFVFSFGPSLFVYYVMNDLLEMTMLTTNTRKLLAIFSMFVAYLFIENYMVDFWKRLAVILQMSGWTLLLFGMIGMVGVRIVAYFMKSAAEKAEAELGG